MRQLVIGIKKKASEYAISLLRMLNNDKKFLAHASNTYDEWIMGYFKKTGLPEIDALAS